ncbi:MAG TPA: tetratricopeptide repeat protein [Anaerolineales bacterium]|nr:tetratricopeptide repeat protein [Anaerolineales bacterium]
MYRDAFRRVFVLSLLILAILMPVLFSGYAELGKAPGADSYVELAEHYARAAQRIPWRGDLYELAGHAYYHAKEYALADDVYQKAFERDRLSPEGWVAWGDVNYLRADPERAAGIWKQGLEQPGPSGQLYERLAQVLEENGEYHRAAEFLQKYVSGHQEDAAARFRLGLLLTVSDQDKALPELTSAAQLDPQLDPAVQILRTALNLASLNGSASERFVITGRGLGLVGEWPLARVAFQEAILADGKNAEAWAWLGEANQQLELPEGGSAELDRALRLDPDSPTVRGLRGLHFQRSSNFREALKEFQAAARLEPDNPAWQVSVGEAHAKLGDLIRALEAYQAATSLAPGEASYWRLLAIFCAQNQINIEDIGVPAAQKAVVLADEDASSLDILGWLLVLDARHEEAEQVLNRALAIDPQHASAHVHLGMLYLQQENRAFAYAHLIKARDLGNEEAKGLLDQFFR